MKSYEKDFPRPQFYRGKQAWENLNGAWAFAFDDENQGERDDWPQSFPGQREITVPFTYETPMSGVNDETVHQNVWYQRSFFVDAAKLKDGRLMLHFEGADYNTRVWVNGRLAGTHTGAYARFSFDVTDLIRPGENSLTVKCEDSLDERQPRGKQRWKNENFGCWYVQTTGIWKTVWLEYRPQSCLMDVKMTPDLRGRALEVEFNLSAESDSELLLEAQVSFGDCVITKASVPAKRRHGTMRLDIYSTAVSEWGIRPWSPEHPDLYDIRFRLVRDGAAVDTVYSYFGMREIRIDKDQILLNGEPLYQRLILDQGYWKQSHLTPPSEEALIEDIDKIKQLGYNGVRKHQKTEDERFAYWCDVKGMLMWSEMAASYLYDDVAVQRFTSEWMEIVRQNYNHPAIITWTPFNESWGVPAVRENLAEQHFTEAIYHLTKAFDPMRPVIVNDGWEHTVSDILTLHDYEEEGSVFFDRYLNRKDEILGARVYHNGTHPALAAGYAYRGQPVLISEFGGIAFQNGESGWGYGNKVESEEAFIRRFQSITTAIKKLPYVCGYCYTQVSDVQQEINGLMDMERNFKIDPQKICEINERSLEDCRKAEL